MHKFPCQPATRPSSGEHNQHQYNQGHQDEPQSPHLSYFMKQYSYTHILPSLCSLHIGVSNRSMSFLYSSSIRRTAMKWLSEMIPTAQLFWSNSKLSHMRRALCGTTGLFLFYQRGREQVHVMLWIPMQEEVKEGRMMGGKKVPGTGRGGALRQPEKGWKMRWNVKVNLWVCALTFRDV